MKRIKFFAVTALAAAALGVGGLAAPESASAAPRYSCERALTMYQHYMLQSNIMAAIGEWYWSLFYLGKAQGLLQAGC